jgi:hypothetical protein
VKVAVFWVVALCSPVEVQRRFRALIASMMEAASTSGTSVNFYRTAQSNNSEDCHIHTRHTENLILTRKRVFAKYLKSDFTDYSLFLFS